MMTMMHCPAPPLTPSGFLPFLGMHADDDTEPFGEVAAPRASDPGPKPAQHPIEGHRILIVEDEMFVALDLEMTMEDLGAHPVGPIGTVDEGLDFLRDRSELETLSAAILDIDLHGEDVFPIARLLRAHRVPFVFHTAHGNRAELKDAWGDVTVCLKPVTPEKLLAAVGDLLST